MGYSKKGESRDSRDFWGDKKTDHYDKYGRKTGESRRTRDGWGDPRTDHFDNDHVKTGESRDSRDFSGDKKTEHYSRDYSDNETADWSGSSGYGGSAGVSNNDNTIEANLQRRTFLPYVWWWLLLRIVRCGRRLGRRISSAPRHCTSCRWRDMGGAKLCFVLGPPNGRS
jgi:hypothetical protein